MYLNTFQCIWPQVSPLGKKMSMKFLRHIKIFENVEDFSCLTLYLLVSSADNFCKQFGPNQAQQNVGPDLDLDCLTL